MKTPVRFRYSGYELEDSNMQVIYYDNDGFQDMLDMLGVPKRWQPQISAIQCEIFDGDFGHVFLCESSVPYSLCATWYILPYYRVDTWKLPYYWKRSSYSKKYMKEFVTDFNDREHYNEFVYRGV